MKNKEKTWRLWGLWTGITTQSEVGTLSWFGSMLVEWQEILWQCGLRSTIQHLPWCCTTSQTRWQERSSSEVAIHMWLRVLCSVDRVIGYCDRSKVIARHVSFCPSDGLYPNHCSGRRTGGQLPMSQLSLRNKWLKFMETITDHFRGIYVLNRPQMNESKTGRCLSKCNRLDLESLGSWLNLCMRKNSQALIRMQQMSLLNTAGEILSKRGQIWSQ